VYSSRSAPIFQINILPPSSGSKCKPSKKKVTSRVAMHGKVSSAVNLQKSSVENNRSKMESKRSTERMIRSMCILLRCHWTSACCFLLAGCLPGSLFDLQSMGQYIPSKCWWNATRLHSFGSQKTALIRSGVNNPWFILCKARCTNPGHQILS
jgi:hypothetical protein